MATRAGATSSGAWFRAYKNGQKIGEYGNSSDSCCRGKRGTEKCAHPDYWGAQAASLWHSAAVPNASSGLEISWS
jgi:hypothetical protein